jgi:hypothetical protein
MCIPIFLQGEDRLAARASVWIFHEVGRQTASSEPTWRRRGGCSANTTPPPGSSGHACNRHHTRHLLNQKFLQALLLDFEAHGREAIEECRKQSGYVKVLGHLVPREMKVERSQLLKSMSDEELEAAIAAIRQMLEDHAGN